MKREKTYYVYIMASRSLNLYTGITDDLYRRATEHKEHLIEGFTKRYRIDRLVYYETFKYVLNAIRREKQIKAWTRAKRIALIKSVNPTWQDLAEHWDEPGKLQIPRFARDDNSIPGCDGNSNPGCNENSNAGCDDVSDVVSDTVANKTPVSGKR